MHRFKKAARSQAWYGDDGGRVALNPFSRTRSRPEPDSDEENGLDRARSETFAPGTEERNRRSLYAQHKVPHHASTMPPPSAFSEKYSKEDDIPDAAAEADKTNKSDESNTNTTDTIIPNDQDEDNTVPRERKKGLLQRFRATKDKHDIKHIEKKKRKRKAKRTPKKITVVSQIRATVFGSYINVLLILAPVGIAMESVQSIPRVAVFVVNFLAIIPLAGMLSFATEEIALRVGETLGGLLNATFGNAVELIVAILALFQNQLIIVQTSLIGSILSNLLLVLGMCFFFGGMNRVKQHFNITVAQTATSLLALAVASLILPTSFDLVLSNADGSVSSDNTGKILQLSRGIAIILLVTYGAYLFFQLKTHADMYAEESKKEPKRKSKKKKKAGDANITEVTAVTDEDDEDEEDEEAEQPTLTKIGAIITLCASTALVGVCAEFMTRSIDAVTESGSGVSKTFVGLILLPIVGNAAEHATALTVACKDKMDLAIGVAVGSSMQIALGVLPLIITIAWIAGKSLSLDFDLFQVVVLFVSVLLVNYLISDGESHWLEGLLLMNLYIMIAIAAWFYPLNTEE